MKVPKGLLKFHDKFWIEEQLLRFAAAFAPRIGELRAVVTLGQKADEYFRALRWLDRSGEWTLFGGVKVVAAINLRPQWGPFSSLQAGGNLLKKENEIKDVFVLPIDVPAPAPDVWAKLAASSAKGVLACQPEVRGRGGHPVLLAGSYFEKLISLAPDDADSRLDVQLRKLKHKELARVPCDDENVVRNLNTPEEWENFISL